MDQAVGFAQVFLSTPFSTEPRHAKRLAMIADQEKTGDLPPLPTQVSGKAVPVSRMSGSP